MYTKDPQPQAPATTSTAQQAPPETEPASTGSTYSSQGAIPPVGGGGPIGPQKPTASQQAYEPIEQALAAIQSGLKTSIKDCALYVCVGVANIDPGRRAELVTRAKPQLDAIGQLVANGDKTTIDALQFLAAAARFLDASVAKTMATSIATPLHGSTKPKPGGAPHIETVIGNIITAEVAAGDGAQFGIALAQAFADQGKTELANTVATGVVAGVTALENHHADDVKARDNQLGQLFSQTGPGMAMLTQQQQSAILTNYQNETGTKAVFDACDASGFQLAEALSVLPALTAASAPRKGPFPALDKQVHDLNASLVELACDPGAQTYFAQQLEKQAKQEPNVVKDIVATLKQLKGDAGHVKDVATLIVKSTGIAAIDLIESGNVKAAGVLFDGLTGLHDLLGVKDEDMHTLTDAFKRGDPRSIETAFVKVNASPGFRNAVGADLLKGLGLALGGWSLIQGVGDIHDPGEAMKSLVEASATASEGAVFALELVGKEAGPFLDKTKTLTGTASSVLGMVFDTIAVGTDLRDLDLTKGSNQAKLGADTLAAISSVIFTAGAFLAGSVPLAGQVIGLLCIVGSFALGEWSKAQAADEAVKLREHWLASQGVNLGCGVSNVLAHADPVAVKAWLDAGMTAVDLQDLIVHYESVAMVSDGPHVAALSLMARECAMAPAELVAMFHAVAPDRAAFDAMLAVIPILSAGDGGHPSARQKWLAALAPQGIRPPPPGAYPTGQGPPPTAAEVAYDMRQSLFGYLTRHTQEHPATYQPATTTAPPKHDPLEPTIGATGTTGPNTVTLP